MSSSSPLKVFTLEYDAATNSISPHVRYIAPDNVLQDLYKVLNCELVTCTEIEVNGKLFDVWSDDEALLKDKPAPNSLNCSIFSNAKGDDYFGSIFSPDFG